MSIPPTSQNLSHIIKKINNKTKFTPKHSINDEYLMTSPRRAKNLEMKRKHNFSVNIEEHRDKKGVLSMTEKPVSKAIQDLYSTRLS